MGKKVIEIQNYPLQKQKVWSTFSKVVGGQSPQILYVIANFDSQTP
jgi:hypothetical protein